MIRVQEEAASAKYSQGSNDVIGFMNQHHKVTEFSTSSLVE